MFSRGCYRQSAKKLHSEKAPYQKMKPPKSYTPDSIQAGINQKCHHLETKLLDSTRIKAITTERKQALRFLIRELLLYRLNCFIAVARNIIYPEVLKIVVSIQGKGLTEKTTRNA